MTALSEPQRRMLLQVAQEHPHAFRIRNIWDYPPAWAVLNALRIRGLVKLYGYSQYQLTPEGQTEVERLRAIEG